MVKKDQLLELSASEKLQFVETLVHSFYLLGKLADAEAALDRALLIRPRASHYAYHDSFLSLSHFASTWHYVQS